MPHDRNGNLLAAGDEAILRCKLIETSPSEGYCNATVEPLFPMPPENLRSCISAINTRQLEKMPVTGDLGEAAYEAYRLKSQGKSLVSGQNIPAWAGLSDAIRAAWDAAAFAVSYALTRPRT